MVSVTKTRYSLSFNLSRLALGHSGPCLAEVASTLDLAAPTEETLCAIGRHITHSRHGTNRLLGGPAARFSGGKTI